jgi:hypothetical protein
MYITLFVLCLLISLGLLEFHHAILAAMVLVLLVLTLSVL